MQCMGHNSQVRCIEWYDDDMGFTSCGMDGNLFFYDLQLQRETGMRNFDRDFLTQKGVYFTGLANVPGQLYSAVVVAKDNKIHKWSA